MKLELEKLAPYLPYGLEVIYTHTSEIGNIKNLYDIECYNDIKIGINWLDGEHIWMFKPILRPLSDLTKEIEINGEKFVPLRKLEELFPCVEFYNDDELSYLFSDTDCRGELFHSIKLNLTLEISNKLFEWHFDVFNLHENDLCIYYNKLGL